MMKKVSNMYFSRYKSYDFILIIIIYRGISCYEKILMKGKLTGNRGKVDLGDNGRLISRNVYGVI